MGSRIVPAFKRGDYSRGVVSGVYALDAMARSKPLPVDDRIDWRFYLWVSFAIVLAVLVLKSLITSGRSGWGWKLIVLVFTILGGILMVLAWTNRNSRRCTGGGGLRGSFGGGRSGGGGATGSW